LGRHFGDEIAMQFHRIAEPQALQTPNASAARELPQALLNLVRALARQAAQEYFASTSTEEMHLVAERPPGACR
jgi:hypothetical protein